MHPERTATIPATAGSSKRGRQQGPKRRALRCTLVGVALVIGAGAINTASAGGLVVPGAGPSAQPRAGAFVARADDPTAISHNPAGFAKLDGTQLTVGANFIDFSLSYQRFGNYEVSDEMVAADYEGLPYPEVNDRSKPSAGIGPYQLLPLLAFSTDLGHPEWPIRVGGGIFTPQGYTARKFDEDYTIDGASDLAPGPQRYDAIEQSAIVIQPSVVVAYKVLPELDVGVRASWGFGEIKGKKAVWGIRNYDESRGQDSLFTLDSAKDKFIPGYSVGVMYRPTPFLEFGAAYNSQLNIDAKGVGSAQVGGGILDGAGTEPVTDEEANCAKGGVEGALKICFDLTVAQSATIGGRWILRDGDGSERADVELNVRWEDWSASKDNFIVVDGREKLTQQRLNPGLSRHGFRDTVSVRLGGSHRFDIGKKHQLTAKAGVAYDTAAAPDSWTRADLDGKARLTLGAGVGFEIGRYTISVGGGAALQPTVDVQPCKPPDGPVFGDIGCLEGGGETPTADRTAPDPQQPLLGKNNQAESPFNPGRYKSGYRIFSLGLTTSF